MPLPITFTLPSLYTYLWMDGSTSNMFTASDSSLVYVYAYSGPGCLTIDSVMVDDYHCVSFIPNFMTPNGDGLNDNLYFDVEGAKSLDCTVYDRWGREIYRWTDVNGYWDGKRATGKEVEEGVYYYVVSITFVDNSFKSFKGFVEIFK